MTVSFHQLHNLKRPSSTCYYTLSPAALPDLLCSTLESKSCLILPNYQVHPPNSLAGLHIASVVRVHAAADTETVGFSAAGVDKGQMSSEGVGYIRRYKKSADANMRWMGTTNRQHGEISEE